MSDYKLEEMGKEEGDKLTAELQEVLAKHGAEMGISSSIQLLKRVQVEPQLIPSPKEFTDGTDEGKEEVQA